MMKLGEFIENFVAKNTLVRLWKPIDKDKPYGDKVMLSHKPVMEWEIQRIGKLAAERVIFVTDIFCKECREAVNIVIQTDYTTEDIEHMVSDFEKQIEMERANCCEG